MLDLYLFICGSINTKQIGLSCHQQIHFRLGHLTCLGSSRRSPGPLVGLGGIYPLPIPHYMYLDAYGVSFSTPLALCPEHPPPHATHYHFIHFRHSDVLLPFNASLHDITWGTDSFNGWYSLIRLWHKVTETRQKLIHNNIVASICQRLWLYVTVTAASIVASV